MTRPYAAGTSVSAEKSRAEIDTLLSKHGATHRGIQVDDHANLAMVAFVVDGLKYRIDVPLPRPEEPKEKPRGWFNWKEDRRKQFLAKEYDQKCRERWRAVVLLLKAKLELVRLGMSSIDREFASDLVLANGQTVFQRLSDQIRSGNKMLMLGDGK